MHRNPLKKLVVAGSSAAIVASAFAVINAHAHEATPAVRGHEAIELVAGNAAPDVDLAAIDDVLSGRDIPVGTSVEVATADNIDRRSSRLLAASPNLGRISAVAGGDETCLAITEPGADRPVVTCSPTYHPAGVMWSGAIHADAEGVSASHVAGLHAPDVTNVTLLSEVGNVEAVLTNGAFQARAEGEVWGLEVVRNGASEIVSFN